MAPRHDEQSCFVAPHPDALARLQAQNLKAQGGEGIGSFKASTHNVATVDRTGAVPGLNDGLIFPKNHFDHPVSVSKMTREALERKPLRGAIRVVVVLAEFPNRKFGEGVKERFQDLFFSTGKIPTGSVTEYFSEVSHGHISFAGEVVGPVELSQNFEYYAAGNYGRNLSEPNSRTMAGEAFEKVNGRIDFAPYDNDGNGFVDAFVVVHAGSGGEETLETSDIWSVKWVLPNEKESNGVKIFGFLTIPEDAKLGVSAHELGHLVFGWPDLYDTDGTSWGVGSWCVMSYGNWGQSGNRPVHPSAWCKANQGWIDVVNETENHQITLEEVKTSYKAHRLWKDGDPNSQEYFLIENRGLIGYDAELPGDGLVVWHIDDAVDSNVDENHPKVGVVQADGLDNLKVKIGFYGDAGDPFPGISKNTAFNAISKPSSKSYAGEDTWVSITDIPQASPSMTFNITVKPIEQTPVGPFNKRFWYRFENTFFGHSMDIINDGEGNKEGLIRMHRTGNFSGQHWQIFPNPDGTYALRTLFHGATKQLDIYAHDKTKPHLADAAWVSGQIWKILPWGDGTWHLENAYSGQFLYLDTMEGGPNVAMNQSNSGRPTQRWTITKIRDITEAGFEN